MIKFNIPYKSTSELDNLNQVYLNRKYCGDGTFTKSCHEQLSRMTSCDNTLLTTSCTHALELAALLIDVKEGDEVIMPSYTFVSTANAFVLRGAKIVFVDVDPITMNMDVDLIEGALTNRTKAIVPVHYGGVACDMDRIMSIAEKHNLFVIEDAAQCIGATYKGKALGTIGHFGTFSFHETKNIHCGEGGALLINHPDYAELAEIMREKGTDRSKFLRGQIDKYSWVSVGSSYLPSEFNAAVLLAQLKEVDKVTNYRKSLWSLYFDSLKDKLGENILPSVKLNAEANAHVFFIKCKDVSHRQKIISTLKEHSIQSVFHYVPLHSAKAGKKHATFHGRDNHTTIESEKLLRLPLHFSLTAEDVKHVAEQVIATY